MRDRIKGMGSAGMSLSLLGASTIYFIAIMCKKSRRSRVGWSVNGTIVFKHDQDPIDYPIVILKILVSR